MKALFQLRVLLVLVIGFLSGCVSEDARVKKKFEEDVIQKLAGIVEGIGLKGYTGSELADTSYNVEKTDSLTSPYVATIYMINSEGTETSWSMAYQNDKWIAKSFKQRNESIEFAREWFTVYKGETLEKFNAFLK